MVAHEYAHAEAAYRQGDDTAYMLGRLTLNPLKHIDPLMTLIVPFLLWRIGAPPFGAAKPVPVNPRKYRQFRRGDIIVSLAGIAVNLGLCVVSTLLFVELDRFSRPLDRLLHLVTEDELDISDRPIAKIADQFLAGIDELGLNRAADYLEMAAGLLRIKAQLLLPRRLGDDEWEDPRAGLVRRLLEYQQIRELVEWLGQAAARRAEQLGRGFRPEPPAAPPAPLVIELNDLLAAAERVIALIPEPVLHRVVPRPLDVEGATARLQALPAERAAFRRRRSRRSPSSPTGSRWGASRWTRSVASIPAP